MNTITPEELLNTYYTRVLGVAYQVLGDVALATQAAETCFERLVGSSASDSINVWRVTLDVLHSYLLRGLAVEPLASDAAGWQAALMDGLAKIEPEERIVLLLSYHERLDHAQLARVLGSTVDQARQDVARARNRLIEVLELRDAMR